MNFKKRWKDHMDRSKKLADDFRQHEIKISFNEKTDEITIPGSEITEEKIKNWDKNKEGK